MSDTPQKLIAKLADVMKAVERVPKRGRNDFHKYDYATEADIAATVRKELSERHVMLIPSITGEERHSVGEKGSVLTVLHMEMQFIDGETGETLTKPWRGYGTDKEDKGGYKAMTGGEKYFLLKTFLVPTGDDPERTEKPEKQATVKKQAVDLPKDGKLRIAEVHQKRWGGEVVLSNGRVLLTKDSQLLALCEQLAQDIEPVRIVARTINKRDGSTAEELTEVHRLTMPEPFVNQVTTADLEPENTVL